MLHQKLSSKKVINVKLRDKQFITVNSSKESIILNNNSNSHQHLYTKLGGN